MAETPGAEATLVASQDTPNDPMLGIAADDSRAYFRTLQMLYAVDAPGAAPTPLTSLRSEGLQQLSWLRLVDGYFYGFECPAGPTSRGGYATRFPAAGGVWKRFAELEGASLQVLGEYYYYYNWGERGIVDGVRLGRGSVSGSTEDTELGVVPHRDKPEKWAWYPTRTGVYWANETAVYFAASP